MTGSVIETKMAGQASEWHPALEAAMAHAIAIADGMPTFMCI